MEGNSGLRLEFNYRRILGTVAFTLLLVTISLVGYNTIYSRDMVTSLSAGIALNSIVGSIDASSAESAASSAATSVSISVSNEYSLITPASSRFPYPFLHNAHLLEPYRESTITVTGLSSDCGVKWQLSQVSGDIVLDGYAANSQQFELIAAVATGKFSLLLSQDCTGNKYEFPVYVKYVRRELSTLTDNDREEFLDAMQTLWTLSTEDGKKIYGGKYKSHAYLSVIHNDGQDNGYCDQFHNGPGFFTSHMYIQAYLEQSMQLVNPRTCLHYWEFTKDYGLESFRIGHMYNQLDGGSWTQFMTEKWFGQSDPHSGRIISGRWTNTVVPFMNDAFFEAEGIDKNMNFYPENDADYRAMNSHMHAFNPYGLLRSSWNFNPSKYMVRYNNVAGITTVGPMFQNMNSASLVRPLTGADCNTLEMFVDGMLNKPLTYLTTAMATSLHTSAHWTPSGYGGAQNAKNDAVLREKFGFTDEMIFEAVIAMFNARANDFTFFAGKQLKTFNCTEFPFDYDAGTLAFNTPPGELGGIQCPFRDEFYSSEEGTEMLLNYLYSSLNLEESVLKLKIDEFDWQKKVELLRVLEWKFPYPSEIGVSASSMDPLFWVLHGSFERLYQLLVFSNSLSSLEYDTVSTCAGHDMNTPKSWLRGFYLQDESIDVSKLTQKQLQDYLNPMSEEFETLQNFVYDSSEWLFCPAVKASVESASAARQ